MKYKRWLKSTREVSAIALGTWVFGGDAWGEIDEEECIATVKTAIDHGINLIDTAPIYGDGLAERIVGRALQGQGAQVFVATKCGLVKKGRRVGNNLSPESIQQELEDSLKRLKRDYVDLYQCHWPDPGTPVEETMQCLNRLKLQGKIRFIGVSNFDTALLTKAGTSADVVSLQSQYSLLERGMEKAEIPFCIQNNINIMAYGVLGGGILTGKYKTPPQFAGSDARRFFYKFYQPAAFQEVQDFLKKLERFNRPLNQIALNWASQQPAVTCVLVGCRSPQQVTDNLRALDWELSPDELNEILHMRI